MSQQATNLNDSVSPDTLSLQLYLLSFDPPKPSSGMMYIPHDHMHRSLEFCYALLLWRLETATLPNPPAAVCAICEEAHETIADRNGLDICDSCYIQTIADNLSNSDQHQLMRLLEAPNYRHRRFTDWFSPLVAQQLASVSFNTDPTRRTTTLTPLGYVVAIRLLEPRKPAMTDAHWRVLELLYSKPSGNGDFAPEWFPADQQDTPDELVKMGFAAKSGHALYSLTPAGLDAYVSHRRATEPNFTPKADQRKPTGEDVALAKRENASLTKRHNAAAKEATVTGVRNGRPVLTFQPMRPPVGIVRNPVASKLGSARGTRL